MSEDRPSKKGLFWSRLSENARLYVVAVLALFIGIELGFILNVGGTEFLYGLITIPASIDEPEWFLVFTSLIAIPFLSRPLYLMGLRLHPLWYWIAGGLVLFASFIEPSILVYCWFLVFAIRSTGAVPLWLSCFCIVFAFAGTVLTAGSGSFYLAGVILIGLWMYPGGISVKRFLIPRRGAI